MVTVRLDKGKPCGEGFIAANKECRAGQGSVASPSTDKKKSRSKLKNADRNLRVAFAGVVISATLVGLATLDAVVSSELSKRQAERQRQDKRKFDEWFEQFQKNHEQARKQYQQAYEEARQRQQQSSQRSAETTTGKKWWEVLGVSPNATKDDIKKAYRQAARKFHPDVNKDPKATEMMKEINNAFDLSGARRSDSDPSTRLRRVVLGIKRQIDTIYRGGVDAVLTFELEDNDAITGKFRDGGEVYDFTISPTNELSYVESKVRSDAYLLGWQYDSGNARGLRTDAPQRSIKKKVCAQGKPCGDGCIAKGLTCRVKLSLKSASELKEIRNEIRALRKEVRELKGSPTPSTPAPKTTTTDKEINNTAKKFNVGKAVAAAGIAGAALAAMPVAGYFAFRTKYQMGFKSSAEEAKKVAEDLKQDVPDTLKGGYKGVNGGEANQITFVVGGFAGQGGDNSLQYAQQFVPNKGSQLDEELKKRAEEIGEEPDLFSDHHVVAINNREFEIRPAGQREKFEYEIPFTGQKLTDGNVEQFRVMLNSAIAQGKNPVAVEMAAKAYAYHQKFPDKPINLLGYSAGGMVTHETAHILKEMGVKNVRVANFGSPYWGATDKVGDAVTFASKNDPDISQGGVAVRDPVLVNSVVDHFSYLRDGDVRRKLKELFDGKPPKAETPVWVPSVTPEPKEAARSVKQSNEAAKKAKERAERIEEIARKREERRKRKEQKKDSYQEAFVSTLKSSKIA